MLCMCIYFGKICVISQVEPCCFWKLQTSLHDLCSNKSLLFTSMLTIYPSKQIRHKCASHYMLTTLNLSPHRRFSKGQHLIYHCASSWQWLKPWGPTTAVLMPIWGCVLFPMQPHHSQLWSIVANLLMRLVNRHKSKFLGFLLWVI